MLKNKKYMYGDRNVVIPSSINFGEFILKRLWLNRNNVALINGATNDTLKYGQIAQQAMNLAVSLFRLGVRKGDMVAIVAENRNEYFSTVIGVASVGATVTLINPFYKKDELKHVTNISMPKYIICSETAYKEHATSFKSMESVKTIILYGTEENDNCILYNDLVIPIDDENDKYFSNDNDLKNKNKKGSVETDRLIRDVDYDDFEVVDIVGQTDPLFMLYSSGTTGLSKGVLLTHFNVISLCCYPTLDFMGTTLNVGPWFHVFGLMGNLIMFSEGRVSVYLPKFEINLYLEIVERYKVKTLIVAPAILVAILKCKKQYDLTSVTRIVAGSAPLHSDVIKNIIPKFPNLEGVTMGYGLTETTLAISASRYDNPKKLNSVSVGKVLPNTVVKIVDSNQNPLGCNETGNICVKGDLIMKGYVGGDTSAAFDDEGFFKTGDVGHYDEDGYLYVVDRMKELIKYKGHQVPPAEIEALLLQHEAVKDVGVTGIPDEDAGEVPVAFIVLQPGMSATEKEIQDYVAERISKTKHLRGGVRFIPEIPKNATGKILRYELKKLALNGGSRN